MDNTTLFCQKRYKKFL